MMFGWAIFVEILIREHMFHYLHRIQNFGILGIHVHKVKIISVECNITIIIYYLIYDKKSSNSLL